MALYIGNWGFVHPHKRSYQPLLQNMFFAHQKCHWESHFHTSWYTPSNKIAVHYLGRFHKVSALLFPNKPSHPGTSKFMEVYDSNAFPPQQYGSCGFHVNFLKCTECTVSPTKHLGCGKITAHFWTSEAPPSSFRGPCWNSTKNHDLWGERVGFQNHYGYPENK